MIHSRAIPHSSQGAYLGRALASGRGRERRLTMRFEVWLSKDGWRVRLRSRNNRILLSSEAYTRKADAVRAAVRLMQHTEVKAVYLD